jgi:hypothetical protein
VEHRDILHEEVVEEVEEEVGEELEEVVDRGEEAVEDLDQEPMVGKQDLPDPHHLAPRLVHQHPALQRGAATHCTSCLTWLIPSTLYSCAPPRCTPSPCLPAPPCRSPVTLHITLQSRVAATASSLVLAFSSHLGHRLSLLQRCY